MLDYIEILSNRIKPDSHPDGMSPKPLSQLQNEATLCIG